MPFSDCVLWFPSNLMQVFQWHPKISQWHCEKQKFIVFMPHHLNHLAHELNGNFPPKEEVSSKSLQTGSHRTDLVVSTGGLDTLVTTANWQCSAGEWPSDFLHSGLNIHSWPLPDTGTRLGRHTLPATSCGSKLPCLQDVVVVRCVRDFLQEKKTQRKIWN